MAQGGGSTTGGRRGGWIAAGVAVALLVVVGTLVVTVGPAGTAGTMLRTDLRVSSATAVHADPAGTVIERTFPHTEWVDALTSVNTTSLLIIQYQNGSYETVLFHVAQNSTKVVQKIVPGYTSIEFVSDIAAGGAFFVSWENLSTSATFWQKITVTGALSSLSSPMGSTYAWNFLYGNLTAMFLQSGPTILEMDPFDLAVIADLSASLGPKVALTAVLPSQGLVYLAGARTRSSGGTDAYFGVYDPATGKVTNVSASPKLGTGLAAEFVTIDATSKYVYVGGAVTVSNASGYGPVQGLLYRYDPSTGAFKNQSAIIPERSWGVYAIEPYSGKVMALSLSGWWESSGGAAGPAGPRARELAGLGSLAGGIYTLLSGGSIMGNTSGIIPSSFYAFIYGVTSSTSGWLFSGGFDQDTSLAAVVGVRG